MEAKPDNITNNTKALNEIKCVHCLFEQSGTFKNEFKKLGINANDYDIQNEFGETDCVCDLFAEIEGGITTNQAFLTR